MEVVGRLRNTRKILVFGNFLSSYSISMRYDKLLLPRRLDSSVMDRRLISWLNHVQFYRKWIFLLIRFCLTKSTRNGSEIALVCFDEQMDDSITRTWKNTLICSVSIISAIFLIATLAIYVILPELRELQDKAMMAAVTTLAVSYTVLSIQHLRPNLEDDYITCISLGIHNNNYI